MKSWSAKQLRFHLIIAVATTLSAWILLGNMRPTGVRAADAFFIGAIPGLMLGVFRLARQLGAFDLLLFANRRVWRRSARKISAAENEQMQKRSDQQGYFEYTTTPKNFPRYQEPLLIGGISFGVSVLIVLMIM